MFVITLKILLYAFFWVIHRRLKFIQTECSETSAYKFQTPGNHSKESIQHSVHGESLKSRLLKIFFAGNIHIFFSFLKVG